MLPEDQAGLAALPPGRFAGREAFAQRVRAALAAAAAEDWPALVLCDADFAAWPLHERALIDSLHAWARAGRSFTIVARGFDTLLRQHARFVQWRRTWDHIVEARVCRSIDAAGFPSVLWSPRWTMQLLDPVRSAGVQGPEPERVVRARELLDELLQRSSPGFPASTLGL